MDDKAFPYTVEQISPKQVSLLSDPTIIWNLHSSNEVTPYVTPAGYSKAATVVMTDVLARHKNGKNYYLLSSRSQGYDVNDCTDFIEPPAYTDEEIQADVLQAEPEVAKQYKAPSGGLNVPLKNEKIYIKVDLKTYPSAMAAADRQRANQKPLYPGSYIWDMSKFGMLRVQSSELGEKWINPADNVVAEKPRLIPTQIRPKQLDLDGSIEAAKNYKDFMDNDGKLSEKYYTAKAGGAFVIDFKNGTTRTMPAGAHVFLAGITSVGDMGYGLATKCIEMQPIRWIGIRLGDLYEDETYNHQTSVEERQFLHTLKPSDYITQMKAKGQRLIMDIRNKKL